MNPPSTQAKPATAPVVVEEEEEVEFPLFFILHAFLSFSLYLGSNREEQGV